MSKKIERELDCILSHEELGELGIRSAEHHHKAKLLKEEAASIEKAAKEMDQQVSTKRVKRKVQCVEIKDFDRNEVRVERCDESRFWPEGNCVIETRAMTGEERQTLIDTGDSSSNGDKVATKAPKGRGKRGANAPN